MDCKFCAGSIKLAECHWEDMVVGSTAVWFVMVDTVDAVELPSC